MTVVEASFLNLSIFEVTVLMSVSDISKNLRHIMLVNVHCFFYAS
jgi:hypothetical protein